MITNKKWFDKECRLKRHEVRKLANQKRRNPMNTELRKAFHDTLLGYKNVLPKKQQNYKNKKLHQLAKSQVSSQSFWKVFKTLPETLTSETPPPVTEADWLKHFETLHSPPQKQSTNQNVALNELENLENLKSTANSLDYPTTK